MPNLGEVRQAIATTIRAELEELNIYPVWADITNLPAVVIGPPVADFTKSMGRGLDSWSFPLMVMVGIPEIQFAQNALDDYVDGSSEKSLRRIIFENPSLGGVVEDSMITKMDEYGGSLSTRLKPLIPHIGACLHLTTIFAGD